MNAEQKTWCKKIPKLYQANYCKAQTSKAAALKAQCLNCTCRPREEVKNCTITTCPLYNHRPYQDRAEREKAPLTGDLAKEPPEQPS